MLLRKIHLERLAKLCTVRSLTTSPVSYLIQKYRKERGLSLNPNTDGILTENPDYSFLDGRMTPYGVGQRDRIVREENTLKQVMELTKEIDFAVERHNQILVREQKKRQAILDSKLKPKGTLLLKSHKSS